MIDKEKIKQAVVLFLEGIGENPLREGLLETPQRVYKSCQELFSGYSVDVSSILHKKFTMENYDQLVLLKNIEFFSFCEHHLLPFFGTCSVAYIPSEKQEGGKVIGISKIVRLVDAFSKRLQIQERLTNEIAYSLNEYLQPKGVGVVMKALHLCMIVRGVKRHNPELVTSCVLGAFRDDFKIKQEFFSLVKGDSE